MPPPVPGTIVHAGAEVGPSGDTGLTGQIGAVGSPGATGPKGDQGYEGSLVGTISIWPGIAPPAGWLTCDGSPQSRATYAQLYGVVGISYGSGDGSTTFNLPDLRSRFVLGAGQGSGLTNRVLAVTGGEETHLLSLAEMPAHSHTITDSGHAHSIAQTTHGHTDTGHAHTIRQINYYPGIAQAGSNNMLYDYTSGNALTSAVATGNAAISAQYANINGNATANVGTGIGINNAGSGSAHNNMPPFIVLTYIIRASYQSPVGATVPVADTTQNGLLRQVSGLTTDFVDGTNNCQDLPTAVRNAIQLIHVRNFNAVGNSTFEVDSRTAGAGVTMSAAAFAQDRWQGSKTASATLVATARQIDTSATPILLPGTNFAITSKFLRVTLTTAQATLAAGDLLWLNQIIEGSRLRELISDVHSVSLLVRSSVTNLSFGMALRDQPAGPVTRSLVKLCSIPTANAWTSIPLPNLNWSPSGIFALGPGNAGYTISLALASGTTYMSPANDTWQNGNFLGAVGQSNFAASPVNSTFDIAFCQHEPGAVCNPFIDIDLERNLDSCLRYYQKTYQYNVAPGTVTAAGERASWQPTANAQLFAPVSFLKPMAKTPAVTIWHPLVANSPNSYAYNASTALTAVNSVTSVGDSGYCGFVSGGAPTAGWYALWHHTADTGW